ncbi:Golgi membrane exchange factor (Ric1p-Rgp1p) subunit [Blastocladiella emersonii ATCC 22665]|nr:Golgi membrane exchange factor (Ric1p-Rgp1p) subunit [Blastocladiella emersonii ATCC 22665]
MPLRVTVTLDQRGVFFAGEKLALTVTVTNPLPDAIDGYGYGSQSSVAGSASSQSRIDAGPGLGAAPLQANVVSPTGSSSATALFGSQSSNAYATSGSPTSSMPLSDVGSLFSLASSRRVSLSGSGVSSDSSSNKAFSRPRHAGPVTMFLGSVQLLGAFAIDPQFVQPTLLQSVRKHAATLGTLFTPNEYPVFVSAKSVLFVNLTLAPGESKSYTYSCLLPLELPPTFRGGRALRVSYRAVAQVVAAPTTPPVTVQAPFRLFPALEDDGHAPCYDLLAPVVQVRDVAKVTDGPSGKGGDTEPPARTGIVASRSHEEIVDFLKSLDDACAIDPDDDEDLHDGGASRISGGDFVDRFVNGGWMRKVNELVLRSPSVVFDIAREDGRVAKLKLRRTLFRLGDTLTGVVDFRDAAIATHRVSIFLESSEFVESSVAARTPEQIKSLTTKLISHVHENVTSLAVLPFELVVPESVSPTLATTGVSLNYHLRVELVTRVHLDRSQFKLSAANERSACLVGEPQVDVDVFSCVLPVRVVPAMCPLFRDRAEALEVSFGGAQRQQK